MNPHPGTLHGDLTEAIFPQLLGELLQGSRQALDGADVPTNASRLGALASTHVKATSRVPRQLRRERATLASAELEGLHLSRLDVATPQALTERVRALFTDEARLAQWAGAVRQTLASADSASDSGGASYHDLELRLAKVRCMEDTIEPRFDEIYVWGSAVDSRGHTSSIPWTKLGEFREREGDDIREWSNGKLLVRMPLGSDWSGAKMHYAVLNLSERDSGDHADIVQQVTTVVAAEVNEAMADLEEQLTERLTKLIVVGMELGASVGAAVATAVGAAIGAAIGLVVSAIAAWIIYLAGDDYLGTQEDSCEVLSSTAGFGGGATETPTTRLTYDPEWQGHYRLRVYWRLV